MRTKRIPIARPPALRLSPRALELFVELAAAFRARRGASCIRGNSPAGYCSGECAACERWWAANNALHDELKLKPWEYPVVEDNPFPPGTPAFREWRPATDDQWGLRRRLDDALRSAGYAVKPNSAF